MNTVLDSAKQRLLQKIRDSLVGEGRRLATPFGEKPLVYADYTASGRSLSFIEDYIREQVLPFYANTHSETSATGRQTSAYREQARATIAKSVNANRDYAVIFSGSGATAAINKIIDILNIRLPADLNRRYHLEQSIPDNDKPVVFIGPYEHHSNDIPWRESLAEVVRIPLNAEGVLDVKALEKSLHRYRDRAIKIGSFSAASNVSGIKTPVTEVSAILKRYSALVFWDYAAAAPYVNIDMQANAIDAIFISTHKFVGGPGSPGLLIVKRELLTNSVPSSPGGGTVSWVNQELHHYLGAGERKEEGGTPAIVESIRAGLVFQLKEKVGANTIEFLEQAFIQRAMARLSTQPNIEILGGTTAPRIAILSFQVRHAGRYLHHGLVTALLNDLFGIQVRGGCSCAGPYGHHLLSIDNSQSQAYQTALERGESILKPGWIRLNFNYFLDESTFDYLLSAIELVAEHGWKMLQHYVFNATHAVWQYRGYKAPAPLTLDTLWQNHGESTSLLSGAIDYAACLTSAKTVLTQLALPTAASDASFSPALSSQSAALRWFSSAADL